MNKLTIYTLKALRKAYTKLFNVQPLPKPACEQDPDVASKLIYDMLMDDKPCMIARFGAFESSTLLNYLGVKAQDDNIIQYVKGESLQWWWNDRLLRYLHTNAGFYPPTVEKIEQFCELMLEDMKELDVLGSWLEHEKIFENELKHVRKVHLQLLEPFWCVEPWTMALKNKKVLVVHPFAEDIENQFNKIDSLFDKPIYPKFELITYKPVQSIAAEPVDFEDWFAALDKMKADIDKIEYDICIVGAGAYGFHIAAHVKRSEKKAFHIGGALQLLFGIRGKRWEDPNYGVEVWGLKPGAYPALMNEHWIRPSEDAKPKNLNIVEGGCYW